MQILCSGSGRANCFKICRAATAYFASRLLLEIADCRLGKKGPGWPPRHRRTSGRCSARFPRLLRRPHRRRQNIALGLKGLLGTRQTESPNTCRPGGRRIRRVPAPCQCRSCSVRASRVVASSRNPRSSLTFAHCSHRLGRNGPTTNARVQADSARSSSSDELRINEPRSLH